MSRTKEVVGVGILSGLITAGAGLGFLGAVDSHAERTVECASIETKKDYKDCQSVADKYGIVEFGTAVVAGGGILGMIGCGIYLVNEYKRDPEPTPEPQPAT